jgi:hypothetical protein
MKRRKNPLGLGALASKVASILEAKGYVTKKRRRKNPLQKKLTIYEALRRKLGREPTHAELKADVKRILHEGWIERAGKGKLAHQRRR